ncbi:MAG: PRD domain-containing protein [Hespellia sp.]|nr:PRD domain-containing protein [Hespellia sp.]
MIIQKVINNNFVIVKENGEKIVMGMGIGFKKRPGDAIEESKIVKSFYLSKDEVGSHLYSILNDVPFEVVETVEKFIYLYSEKEKKTLNETIHLSLIDHIHSAILRYSQGQNIPNAFLFDVKRFYPEEYSCGKELVCELNRQFEIELSDDEAGFVALHLVTACMKNEDSSVYKITETIKSITNLVRRYYGVEFDTDSVSYHRFITHLKYFVERICNPHLKKLSEEANMSVLFKTVIPVYPDEYSCVQRIVKLIETKYKTHVSEEEQFYLTVHLARIIKEMEGNSDEKI